jgi:hypothetical protein
MNIRLSIDAQSDRILIIARDTVVSKEVGELGNGTFQLASHRLSVVDPFVRK